MRLSRTLADETHEALNGTRTVVDASYMALGEVRYMVRDVANTQNALLFVGALLCLCTAADCVISLSHCLVGKNNRHAYRELRLVKATLADLLKRLPPTERGATDACPAPPASAACAPCEAAAVADPTAPRAAFALPSISAVLPNAQEFTSDSRVSFSVSLQQPARDAS